MQDKREFEKEIESIDNSKEKIPENKYFENIWNSIEYRAPVGQKYYLRLFFSLLFFLAFITFFFFYYSDFISSVLILKKLQKENSKFVTIQNNKKHLFKKNKIIRYSNLTIQNEIESNYRIDKNTNVYNIFLEQGNIKLNSGIISDKITVNIYCPDITLTINKGSVDIFCYDNIIRIIPIKGIVEYSLKTLQKKGKIITGESLFLLNRDKIIIN